MAILCLSANAHENVPGM